MKAKSWMAGVAAAATLFAAMTAPASAMAEESGAPGAAQSSASCTATSKTITVKGKDADAFKTWSDKTPLANRTFKVAKVADYKIGNGASGGSLHLETVRESKAAILQAVKDLPTNTGQPLYEGEENDGDPMKLACQHPERYTYP